MQSQVAPQVASLLSCGESCTLYFTLPYFLSHFSREKMFKNWLDKLWLGLFKAALCKMFCGSSSSTPLFYMHAQLYGFFTTYICFTVLGFRLAERDQRTISANKVQSYSGILHKCDFAVIEKCWVRSTDMDCSDQPNVAKLSSPAQVTWQQQAFQVFLWESKVQPFAASIMLLELVCQHGLNKWWSTVARQICACTNKLWPTCHFTLDWPFLLLPFSVFTSFHLSHCRSDSISNFSATCCKAKIVTHIILYWNLHKLKTAKQGQCFTEPWVWETWDSPWN